MARTKQTSRRVVYSSSLNLQARRALLNLSAELPITTKRSKQSRNLARVVHRKCLNCSSSPIFLTVKDYKNHALTVLHLRSRGLDPNKYTDGHVSKVLLLQQQVLSLSAEIDVLLITQSLPPLPIPLALPLLSLPCDEVVFENISSSDHDLELLDNEDFDLEI